MPQIARIIHQFSERVAGNPITQIGDSELAMTSKFSVNGIMGEIRKKKDLLDGIDTVNCYTAPREELKRVLNSPNVEVLPFLVVKDPPAIIIASEVLENMRQVFSHNGSCADSPCKMHCGKQ